MSWMSTRTRSMYYSNPVPVRNGHQATILPPASWTGWPPTHRARPENQQRGQESESKIRADLLKWSDRRRDQAYSSNFGPSTGMASTASCVRLSLLPGRTRFHGPWLGMSVRFCCSDSKGPAIVRCRVRRRGAFGLACSCQCAPEERGRRVRCHLFPYHATCKRSGYSANRDCPPPCIRPIGQQDESESGGWWSVPGVCATAPWQSYSTHSFAMLD